MPIEQLETSITAGIVRRVKSEAKRHGLLAFTLKVHGGAMQTVGLPDLLVILKHPGEQWARTCWIEVKRPGRKATPIQRAVMGMLSRIGVLTGTVHSANETIELLTSGGRSMPKGRTVHTWTKREDNIILRWGAERALELLPYRPAKDIRRRAKRLKEGGRPCTFCGKPIPGTLEQWKSNRKYCSKTCTVAAAQRMNKAKRHARIKQGLTAHGAPRRSSSNRFDITPEILARLDAAHQGDWKAAGLDAPGTLWQEHWTRHDEKSEMDWPVREERRLKVRFPGKGKTPGSA